jgi:hypothetical protein
MILMWFGRGGMARVFGGVYASSTLGIMLREFTFGHVSQLSGVLRRHVIALAGQTKVLDGIADRAFVDIDSLLRPVYGHAKQGASYGHAKIAGKTILRKGLSPLAATLSTPTAAPVLAAVRLRAGKAGSGKGAASMVSETVGTARAAGAVDILVRGDCAYGNSHVAAAARKAGARFSLTVLKTGPVNTAITGITDDAWVPVRYPGAVTDPDTGTLISDAEVAEISEYTAFTSTDTPVTARLIIRRVRDANQPEGQDPLFPLWRYHPFLTDSDEPAPHADITHRRHAIMETVWSDLIDGPWAHQPSGRFAANAAWAILAAICHNLLRAAASMINHRYAVARGATLRRHLINIPARMTRPAGRPRLRLPTHWPHAQPWKTLWRNTFGTSPPLTD